MTHSLVLEVPENIYHSLAEKASKNGKKIEEIALEKLADDETEQFEDPFEKFIGAFDSGGMDWAKRHDELLGDLKI